MQLGGAGGVNVDIPASRRGGLQGVHDGRFDHCGVGDRDHPVLLTAPPVQELADAVKEREQGLTAVGVVCRVGAPSGEVELGQRAPGPVPEVPRPQERLDDRLLLAAALTATPGG